MLLEIFHREWNIQIFACTRLASIAALLLPLRLLYLALLYHVLLIAVFSNLLTAVMRLQLIAGESWHLLSRASHRSFHLLGRSLLQWTVSSVDPYFRKNSTKVIARSEHNL